MIKVLYIITKADMGGAQKYVSDLADNLDKNKFESKIIYGKKDLKWLSNKTYPWFLFLNDWLAVFELVKKLKQEKPSIVHLNSSKAGVIGALAATITNLQPTTYNLRRIKVVFTAHGWVFNPANELNWLIRYFYIFLHKFAAKFTDKIICVSEYDYNLALQYKIGKTEKLSVIHNGINPNIEFLDKKEARKNLMIKIFNNLKIKDSELSKSLNPSIIESLNSIWIGSIGRFVKEKNYQTLIEAAALVPNAYFFIIGTGLEKQSLGSRIQNLKLTDRFFIIEPSGNDAKYLKAFDIFAMSSIKEGLPYTLLEAMAAEVPIATTETGGIPEVIKNNVNGLMIAKKDPIALAQAINQLIKEKEQAKELAKEAKKTVQEKFSLEQMMKTTEEIYLKI